MALRGADALIMCTRFVLRREDLELLFKTLGLVISAQAASRYNIAPSQRVAGVRASTASSQFEPLPLRWGFQPRWARANVTNAPLVNARSEDVEQRPTFKEAFRARRCLLPCSGFYEWHAQGRARDPWFFTRADGQPFFLAALWAPAAESPQGEPSTAVLTTAPNECVARIHHRMPAIVMSDQATRWLRGSPAEARALLQPFPAQAMLSRPVSSQMNSAQFEGPECIAAATSTPTTQLSLFG